MLRTGADSYDVAMASAYDRGKAFGEADNKALREVLRGILECVGFEDNHWSNEDGVFLGIPLGNALYAAEMALGEAAPE